MNYYKNINNGFIVSISTNAGQIEITQEEFEKIKSLIANKPTKENFDYILNSEFEWVEVVTEIGDDANVN